MKIKVSLLRVTGRALRDAEGARSKAEGSKELTRIIAIIDLPAGLDTVEAR